VSLAVEPLAVSTGIQIAYVVGLLAVLFGPVTVAEMKGNDILVGAGFFTLGIAWWIAALRLAKPKSWWARHFYGPRKLARAEARWGEDELG
jgi:hypothetical protein